MAKALADLGKASWQQCVRGDADDLTRLAQSGDSFVLDKLETWVQSGSEEAVTALVKAEQIERLIGLVSSAPAASKTLADMGETAAIEPLALTLEMLAHQEEIGIGEERVRVCAAAAEALGRLKGPRSIDALSKLMSVRLERFGERRVPAGLALAVVRALGEQTDLRVVDMLVPALVDPDGSVRGAVSEGLAKLGECTWREWVKGDREDFARLGDSGRPQALDLLVQASVGSEDSREIAAILSARPDGVQLLIRALERGSMDAAEALGEMKDTRAVQPLVRAMQRDGEWVWTGTSCAAATALAKMPTSEATLSLIKHLHECKWANVRDAIIDALGDTGDLRAAQPLAEAIAGSPEVIAGILLKWSAALVKSAHLPRVIASLIVALQLDTWEARKAAATVLTIFAKRKPIALAATWGQVRQLICAPHQDSGRGPYSSDCHGDTGIGLDFPESPDDF